MINGVQIKVCGLTSVADAKAAAVNGADYLGFILYPRSPRFVSREAFDAMRPQLPDKKKVGVVVYSSMEELEQYKDAGFDFIQLHFPNDTPFFEVAMWTEIIPPNRLWLAPRVPPGKEMDPAFFPLADHVLVDTYHDGGYGGSGKTGNWTEFARLRERFTKVTWILAGGLNPDNIADAVKTAGAKIVDVNSGIEMSPGVKDHAKLKAFFDALNAATVA
jgi:phosphoribosylanthranilate isomerase